MNWTSAARSASDAKGPQALGGLGEPAARHREPAEQLLLEDLVDPERPDILDAAQGIARWHPSARAGTGIRRCRRAGACRRSASGRAVRRADADPCRLDGVLEPAGDSRTQDELAYARPMSSTLPTSSRDLERDAQVLDPLVDLAERSPRPMPRVLRAWPSISRAPTARAARQGVVRPMSSIPRTWRPSIRIWARPAIARARATDGGSAGMRRTAVR